MIQATAFIVCEKQAPFQPKQVKLNALQSREVLVDLKATGICQTDLVVQSGKIPIPFPAILGHEGAGVIRAVGSAVTDFVVGDHVVLSYNHCTTCSSCRSGKTFQCLEMRERNFGGQRADGSQTVISDDSNRISTCFFGQSAFCNPAVVQEACCVKVDKDLPLSVLCSFGCGFQTGTGSVFNVVRPVERKTRSLLVFGLGSVGVAAIIAAKILAEDNPGVLDTIIAVDIVDDKLSIALELGATHIINSAKEDLKGRLAEINNGEGLDAAIDCTGVIAVVNSMVSLVGAGGVAVTVGGPPPGLKASIDVFDVLINCKTYHGCHQGNAYSKTFIPFMIDLFRMGRLPLERLQKTYKVADINSAVSDMKAGRVWKPVLLWN
ncbi:GroES-like protein [Aspergillus uvarum CBS 121591]|uniref:GroES-like protein n=1 Tax=Aspergillus uvarum CBS 121591 TaxID=1448315 RepID=A0A319BZP9_9EURO|nr:GroES-like protein [Aspergillus uvarum CBS 121591]PYH76970.1 GroES-like protein [Aspergillus uvarum CBS 121591]